MAFPIKRRKTFRRRKVKRKVKKAPQASTAIARIGYSSGLNFLPDKFISKMKWNKSYAIAAGTTDVANIKQFVLTGLFDPEVAVATALQPYGFDQLMTYYAHYMVLTAKPKITFVHKAGNPTLVGAIVTAGTSTTNWSSVDDFINDPQSNYRLIHNESPSTTIRPQSYSKSRVFGKTKDAVLTGTVLSNSAEAYYLNTYHINAAPGDTQSALVMLVEIEYTAIFTERLTAVKS